MPLKIQVQTSKHLSVPIIAATIALEKDAKIEDLPSISDVSYMVNVAQTLGYRVSANGNITSFENKGDIVEYDYTSIEGNIRQNILLLPLCFSHTKTIFPIPQGDVIGKRPIDSYFQVLNKFGFSIEKRGKSISIERESFLFPQEIPLEIDSTGITMIAIISVLRNIKHYLKNDVKEVCVSNISVDLEIKWFIEFLNNNLESGKITYYPENKSLKILLETNLSRTLIGKIPIDRVALFDKLLFARLFHKKIQIDNIQKTTFLDTLGRGMNVLNDIGVEIIYENGEVINHNLDNQLKYTQLTLTAKKYPELSTDMLPLLTTFYVLQGLDVQVFDKYFEDRASLLEIQLEKLKTGEKFIFESENIRQTLCGLMAMIFSNKITKVIDYNKSLYRGYEKNIVSKIEAITGQEILVIETNERVSFELKIK